MDKDFEKSRKVISENLMIKTKDWNKPQAVQALKDDGQDAFSPGSVRDRPFRSKEQFDAEQNEASKTNDCIGLLAG